MIYYKIKRNYQNRRCVLLSNDLLREAISYRFTVYNVKEFISDQFSYKFLKIGERKHLATQPLFNLVGIPPWYNLCCVFNKTNVY